MQGDWQYHQRFTTEDHRAVSLRLFYLTLGHLSRAFQLEPELTFEGARWFFGYTALLSIFFLCRNYFKNKLWVWLAFFMAVLGSGLGWLELLAGWQFGTVTPVDFWLIDAYVFFSLSLFPHFSFSITLMALGLLFYQRFLASRNGWFLLPVAAAGVLTELVNPIAFVLVDAAIFFSSLSLWMQEKRRWKSLCAALGGLALSQLPLMGYNVSVLKNDPAWSLYTAQNVTLSPSPLHLLFAFGLFWPAALLGIVRALHRRNAAFNGLTGWLVCAFVLAYLPTLIQRRFLLAVTLPFGLLALYGLVGLADWLGRKRPFSKPLFLVSLAIMTSISTLYLVYGNLQVLKSKPESLFYPASLDAALDWLKGNASPNDFVLAAEDTSQLVAQKSGLRVYIGHEMETLHYDQKTASLKLWYSQNLPPEILKELPVAWVIYGPYEKTLAPDFSPADHLERVYDRDGIEIFSTLK